MTDHTTAAQAADINPLNDEYVNAVIRAALSAQSGAQKKGGSDA
ncbi:hypothetical protein [Achromobacter aegrifaciens]